jgi:hypothetical protein
MFLIYIYENLLIPTFSGNPDFLDFPLFQIGFFEKVGIPT